MSKKGDKRRAKKAHQKACKDGAKAAELKRRRSVPDNVWRCPGAEPWLPTLPAGLGALGALGAILSRNNARPQQDRDGG